MGPTSRRKRCWVSPTEWVARGEPRRGVRNPPEFHPPTIILLRNHAPIENLGTAVQRSLGIGWFASRLAPARAGRSYQRGGQMEPRTERLLLILADISGYTKFMLASQMALVHGQQVITALIEAILNEVSIPLEVKEIEGDAVFLYSVRPRDDEAWEEVSAEVGRKLLRFFEVFSAVLVAESESSLCHCAVCRHLKDLKLKIIVHSGEALLHNIGDFAEVSGVDVILVHRLLKNSVDSDEYILMTEPAHRDLRFPTELTVHKSSEEYEGFGSIPTLVHFPNGAFEESRQAFLSGDTGQILATTLGGGLRDVKGQFKALFRGDQLASLRKLPLDQRGLGRSILAGLMLLVMTPIQLLVFPPLASARALIRRRRAR